MNISVSSVLLFSCQQPVGGSVGVVPLKHCFWKQAPHLLPTCRLKLSSIGFKCCYFFLLSIQNLKVKQCWTEPLLLTSPPQATNQVNIKRSPRPNSMDMKHVHWVLIGEKEVIKVVFQTSWIRVKRVHRNSLKMKLRMCANGSDAYLMNPKPLTWPFPPLTNKVTDYHQTTSTSVCMPGTLEVCWWGLMPLSCHPGQPLEPPQAALFHKWLPVLPLGLLGAGWLGVSAPELIITRSLTVHCIISSNRRNW